MADLVIKKSEEGFTVWSSFAGIPVVVTDAPKERLKTHPEYMLGFVQLLFEEYEKQRQEISQLKNNVDGYRSNWYKSSNKVIEQREVIERLRQDLIKKDNMMGNLLDSSSTRKGSEE
ncbi:hypothetical protein [Bacillus sp. B-jedd]|uniref:hypothetical protein n=1 Tax=Bacillus sp. B-jedd TaxID=1476857 RepID=UPI0005156643|nr:hypothetical protein [Bacillus sp. B-jedd]CEG25992.1 hypothetical protein BN1002_00830 [Bacillus sp. B-jedd]